MKMREPDADFFLFVADGVEISTQISQSRACINNGDAIRIGERDLHAGGVAAELLKTGIADGDGAPRAIKLKPHRILLDVDYLKSHFLCVTLMSVISARSKRMSAWPRTSATREWCTRQHLERRDH